MKNINFRIKNSNSFCDIDYELYVYTRKNEQVTQTGQILMTEKPEGCFAKPTARLTQEQTQLLFNDLWQIGFRPSDGTGNSGHVGAIEKHLKDMRVIVAKQLDINLL